MSSPPPAELSGPRSCDQLLSVGDAAARLRVSTRSVYRLIEEGRIKGIKVRGCTRIRESHLADLLDQFAGSQASG
jgi:excisionase family DNA binding protein